MCGLVGVICKRPNGFSKDHQDIFSTLLFVDTLRGRDSTGVFTISNEGDVFVAKDEGYAPLFMQKKEYAEAQQRAWRNGSAMIGHNRAATRGEVSDENAHPFNVDNNIILVHNGTMWGSHKKHADVAVDSHAIAHLIHEKKDVAEALSSFDGAYALIWYDVEKGQLNLIRNKERPLYWLELEDAWVWSSEQAMLNFAVNRVGVKVKTPPTSLPIDTIQRFTLNNKGWKCTDEKIEIKKPEPPSITYYGGVHHIMGGARGESRDQSYYDSIACAWDDETAQDPPFRQVGSILTPNEWTERRKEFEAAQRARAAKEALEDAERKHPIHGFPGQTRSGQEDEGGSRQRSVVERHEPRPDKIVEAVERTMARKLNKLINHGHYSDIVLRTHTFNTGIHCSPFEYGYVNGRDSNDGFYLYASPFDDEDIILRQWFSAKAVTEERMVQLAGCDYVFELTMGVRQWFPLEIPVNYEINKDTPGYCIISCTGAKMISSGVHSERSH